MTQCMTCQFYDRNNARAADGRAVQWGLCRREAPHLNALTAKAHAIEGVWPTVRDDDWCGEWQVQRRRAAATAVAVAAVAVGPTPASAASTGRAAPVQGGAAAIAAGYKPTPAKRGE